MIAVQNLRKSYQKNEVLRGISFEIQPGVVTGIVGPNACGKTTLIKCILGLVIPSGGDILLAGKKINGLWQYRERIGYLPQSPDFPPHLQVKEILTMIEDLRGAPTPLKTSLLEMFSIGNVLERQFGLLSGGTKQKVAMVSALMFDPEILVFDEPTVGLDPISSVCFKQFVEERVKLGRTVILVSHMLSEIGQLARQMIFLLDGRIQFSGELQCLKEKTGESDLERAVLQLLSKDSAL